MGDSLWILLFFAAGLLLGRAGLLPEAVSDPDLSLWALWLLMGLVGLSLGADSRLASALRSMRPGILLLPLTTTAGTFAGAALASVFLAWTLSECLAMGAGFAYYSLSSVFISQYKGPELGAAALLCNIARELFTLLFAPLVVRLFGPAAAISCGGASTMDTTLPVIARSAGASWVFPAILHAAVLDFSVPFWVALFCAI